MSQTIEHTGQHSTLQVSEMFFELYKIPWYGIRFCMNDGGAVEKILRFKVELLEHLFYSFTILIEHATV